MAEMGLEYGTSGQARVARPLEEEAPLVPALPTPASQCIAIGQTPAASESPRGLMNTDPWTLLAEVPVQEV